MKKLWSLAIVLAAPLVGCASPAYDPNDDAKIAEELNVNSRYIIENVRVSSSALNVNISDPLRTDLDKVVGSKFDDSALKSLADRIRKELHVSDVAVKVIRGSEPDHVIVNFEVTKQRDQNFDLSVAKFVYNSKEGWTGDGSATTTVHGNSFTVGLLSDGDSLVERFAGVRAKFERKSLWTKRLQVRFEFDDYHEQWNRATLLQASPNDIYQSRQVLYARGNADYCGPTRLDLRRQLRALTCTQPRSNGGRWGCGGENRILQRGGMNSALPPALGFGENAVSRYSSVLFGGGGTRFLGSDMVSRAINRGSVSFPAAPQDLSKSDFSAGVLNGGAPVRTVRAGRFRDAARME